MISAEIMEEIKPGAKVRVWETLHEGDKTRVSSFDGLVLARKHGKEQGGTFTVRATILGVGVEKVFPLYAPTIDRVEVLSSPHKVRKAKLYYIRELSPKKIRQKLQKLGAGA